MLSESRQWIIDNNSLRSNQWDFESEYVIPAPFLVESNKQTPLLPNEAKTIKDANIHALVIPPYYRVEIRTQSGDDALHTYCPMLSTRIVGNVALVRLSNLTADDVLLGATTGLFHDSCDLLRDTQHIANTTLVGTNTISIRYYLEGVADTLTSGHEPSTLDTSDWFIQMCMGKTGPSIGNVPHVLWTPGSTACDNFMTDLCMNSKDGKLNPVCSCIREQEEMQKSDTLPTMVTCYGDTCMSTGYIFPNMRMEACGSTMCTQQTNGLNIEHDESGHSNHQQINLIMNCGNSGYSEPQDDTLSTTTTIKKDHIFSNILIWYIVLGVLSLMILMNVCYVIGRSMKE
jgi:hypothetical protein